MWSSQGDMCGETLMPGRSSVPGAGYRLVKMTDRSCPNGAYGLMGKTHRPNHHTLLK